MKNKPDINRVVEFNQLLLTLRAINRKVHIPPANKQPENDVEHSYNLAMAAWFLAQYFPEIDLDKVVRLALAHDLIEVHSGDTFSYGSQEELSSKDAREQAAREQLEHDWPDFPALLESIQEYEARQTPEAKFVYSLDKLMPAILNYLGKGGVWTKHAITLEQFRHEKESKMPISPEIYPYYEELLEILKQHPSYFHQGR